MPDLSGLPWRRIVGIAGAFAVAAIVGGELLVQLWTPPPGVAYQGEWFPRQAGPDLMFAATAYYVALAGGLGLALGIGIALLRGNEWATLVTTGLAALAAGWLMHAVAVAQGPDDPRPAAQEAADMTPLEGALVVAAPGDARHIFTSTVSLSMPVGALTGLAGVYLVAPRRRIATLTPPDRPQGR